MCNGENGYTSAMRETFKGGYHPLYPGHPNFNQELEQMTVNIRPDIVFIQTQNQGALYPHVAQSVGKLAFTLQFSGDIRWTTEQFYKEIGRGIQLTTFSNGRDVDNCIKDGINADFLQIGIDPQIFKPIGIQKDPAHQVVMLFNNYAGHFELSNYREQIVHLLLREFAGKTSVWGNGWNGREAGNLNHSQAAENELLNKAKIAINVSHFNALRYSSDRLLRSLASGVMVISHRYPGIEIDFQDGVHLVCYDSDKDLVNKVRYYLEHDEERERIAAEGCKLAHQRHTFKNMAEDIAALYHKWKK